MIIDFIEKLQDKPKHERVKIMWLAVFVCMLLIVSYWFFSLKKLIRENANKPMVSEEMAKEVEEIKKTMPADNLKAGINSLFENNSQTKSPFENKK